MADEKRNFRNIELDVLDEIRYLLEVQAETLNPSDDESITSVKEYGTEKASILDRIRRAQARIVAHPADASSLRIKGSAIVEGVAAAEIVAIIGQYNEITSTGNTTSIYSTSASTVIIEGVMALDQEIFNKNYIELSGTDGGDDGVYEVDSTSYDSLHGRFTYNLVGEPLSGLTTAGTAEALENQLTAVIESDTGTGLEAGTTVEIIGSDGSDGEYTFASEEAHPTEAGQYIVRFNEDLIESESDFGTLNSVVVVSDIVIENPFASLLATAVAFFADGSVLLSTQTPYFTVAADNITLSAEYLSFIGASIGDTVYYAVDSFA